MGGRKSTQYDRLTVGTVPTTDVRRHNKWSCCFDMNQNNNILIELFQSILPV